MINFFVSFIKILLYRRSDGGFLLLHGLSDTIKLTFCACMISSFLGFLLAVCLYLCKINNKKKIYFIINSFINIILSTPYIILIILIVDHVTAPYLKWYYGFKPSLVCLSFILIFVFARNCAQIFEQMNPEIYQTAYSLGANNKQFIIYFLLNETRVFLILKIVSLFISAIAYSSVLHLLGQAGLSGIILDYGRLNQNINFNKIGFSRLYFIFVYVIVIFLLVQTVHVIANFLCKKLDKIK
ncbi:ABC transporter permease subunit [Candidatus Phytoplasma fraxini]|uniref:Methionine ABC transporter permease subunit (MetI) n=1 Tax=Ash yellows phytoplasma TaxID=35780 RepID=A0ABZ2U820_ASHYP